MQIRPSKFIMSTYTVYCNWLPLNNFLFQVANVWLVFSYLCPPTLNGLLYLRLSLGFAGLFFALWGWLVLCAPDTALWNLFFFIGNFLHLGYLLISRWSKKFSENLEEIYVKIFKPLHLPRHQFQYLAEKANVKTEFLSPGEVYMIDGVTECETLAILLKGRMDVRKHGKLVHIIEEYQFINSPEWVVSQDVPYTFEVTMSSVTDCKIISWNRKMLLNILEKNIFLKTIVDSVISRDIAQKLFSLNKRVKGEQGLTHSIYSLNEIIPKNNEETQRSESSIGSCANDDNDSYYNCESKLLNIDINDRETTL